MKGREGKREPLPLELLAHSLKETVLTEMSPPMSPDAHTPHTCWGQPLCSFFFLEMGISDQEE